MLFTVGWVAAEEVPSLFQHPWNGSACGRGLQALPTPQRSTKAARLHFQLHFHQHRQHSPKPPPSTQLRDRKKQFWIFTLLHYNHYEKNVWGGEKSVFPKHVSKDSHVVYTPVRWHFLSTVWLVQRGGTALQQSTSLKAGLTHAGQSASLLLFTTHKVCLKFCKIVL